MTYKEIGFFSKKIEKEINQKYILLDMKIADSNFVFLLIQIFGFSLIGFLQLLILFYK